MRLAELGEVLGMEQALSVIECFDISHLHGTGTVGSMSRFGMETRQTELSKI
jgi:excinuclease UvrABC nuclease subunit